VTRRDFLRAGALFAGAVGLSLTELAQPALAGSSRGDVNCILLFLVGGPSQLDTWDLKPNAPTDVRGPFRPVRTSVPGVEICEHFPQMAMRAEHFALVRSVHHDEAPIHETGHQLMQTGHLFSGGQEHPHYGAVLSHLRGASEEAVPPFVVLPAPIGNTGVSVSHGQTAGYLGARHEPFVLEADPARLTTRRQMLDAVDTAHRAFDALQYTGATGEAWDRAASQLFAARAKKAFDLLSEKDDLRVRYGYNTFGQSCLLARRLVEHGVRLATVNMFDCVFNEITWDCHADGGALPTTLDDYRDTLCPMFDQAYTALLDDLAGRGLLETTLVVAMGEFGRTPRINPQQGREHWGPCSTTVFAGGGVRGGQIYGKSDRIAAYPTENPVSPEDMLATMYHALE